jgi:hypothetical protein
VACASRRCTIRPAADTDGNRTGGAAANTDATTNAAICNLSSDRSEAVILPKNTKDTMPEIDLTGPEGNAFALMAHAKRFAEQLELDGGAIIAEMKGGDYENLIKVFERHFGEYVILYR